MLFLENQWLLLGYLVDLNEINIESVIFSTMPVIYAITLVCSNNKHKTLREK